MGLAQASLQHQSDTSGPEHISPRLLLRLILELVEIAGPDALRLDHEAALVHRARTVANDPRSEEVDKVLHELIWHIDTPRHLFADELSDTPHRQLFQLLDTTIARKWLCLEP